MTPANVNIVRLEPMRVASTYGFGESPEEQAWRKMSAWSKPRGFLDDLTKHPMFGFNNPSPTPEHQRYGYEMWITVGPEVEPEGDVRIIEFFGGLYAVARCDVHGHPENIPACWQSLAEWCKEHNHPLAHHHALEKFLTTPDDLQALVLELYCPIVS